MIKKELIQIEAVSVEELTEIIAEKLVLYNSELFL